MIPGQRHFPAEQDNQYERIFAGVAWPAERAGFIVVVGEHRFRRAVGLPVLEVLDEASDGRLWELLEKSAVLWSFYHCEQFLADTSNAAAVQFSYELRGNGFSLQRSLLTALDGPMGYALPVLRRLMDLGRLLIPKNSMLAGELLIPPTHADFSKLALSDYPGIAALSFAALGLESTRQDDTQVRQASYYP